MCFPDGEPWNRWRVAEYGRCVARYDEEQLVSYEAGFESTLGDGRLRFSGAAFCYDYSDRRCINTPSFDDGEFDGMAEKIVRANGIDIWTEDFGNPGDPPLLLIMGASA